MRERHLSECRLLDFLTLMEGDQIEEVEIVLDRSDYIIEVLKDWKEDNLLVCYNVDLWMVLERVWEIEERKGDDQYFDWNRLQEKDERGKEGGNQWDSQIEVQVSNELKMKEDDLLESWILQ